MKKRIVKKVGVLDADYPLTKYQYTNGTKKRVWICPYYSRWCNMLDRCYTATNKPTYTNCTVCEEWLTFSNFKAWMMTQQWKGLHLDKDFLIENNQVYGPNTCLFIEAKINTFITDNAINRNGLIGAWYDVKRESYLAQCRDPFTGKKKFLGRYPSDLEAHKAWKEQKHIFACALASSQSNKQVARLLTTKYKD